MSIPRTGYPYLDDGGPVLAFAHRGGALHPDLPGPENTMAAFRHALSLGYRYLETDVHATTDGVVVVFHDFDLERVAGRTGTVGSMTHAEVRSVLVAGQQLVPTLESLLEELPEARFNVDVKADAAVEPLARLVERTGCQERVCVGAFSQRRLARLRSLLGDRVATAAGPREAAAFRLLPWARAGARVLAPSCAALQVPLRIGSVRVVTPGLVRRAHAAGRHVHVWTVDDVARMHELLDLGVDGIITDRTDLLREVLRERGQWTGGAR